MSKPITREELADALDCFWNAAISAAHERRSSEAMDVASVMAEGIAAIANRLREPPPPSSHVAVTEVAKRYLAAIDSDPENDIWDTWDGKPAEGALKTASDASWAEHGQKIEARLSELRAALATTDGEAK